jgi:dTDP-4-dehydrorhamnose reductase
VRILVLGGNGMLGHRATAVLSARHDVTATVRKPDPAAEAFAPTARFVSGVSAEDLASVAAVISETRPDAVLDCIGIVKQRAEAHDAIASVQVNSLFPHQAAKLATDAGARFVHVSTDCVFTGACGGYTEGDVPDAFDLYGRSKLLGEVVDVAGAVTVRTSIVGWEIENPTGVLEWFAARRGGRCDGYTHAVFSGLSTTDLVAVMERLCTEWTDVDGLWHVSNEPVDKFELLTLVRDACGWDIEIDPADEPVIDRSLDSTRFRDRTGWRPREWAETAAALAAERGAYEALRDRAVV